MNRLRKSALLISILTLFIILSGCNIIQRDYKPGYWDNNTFIHNWADIQFKLPESFIKADKETIESFIANNPDTVIAGPDTDITKATSIIEFLVTTDNQDLSSLKTITFVVENIKALNIKNEDGYIEYQKQMAESVGFNFFSEKQNAEIGDKTFTCFDAVTNSIGLNMIVRTCFRIKDDYAIAIQIITSGSNNENEIDALMKNFTNIK